MSTNAELITVEIYRVSQKKMSPLTKCDTITPSLDINKIRHIDPDVHADMWYTNVIDRSRNA